MSGNRTTRGATGVMLAAAAMCAWLAAAAGAVDAGWLTRLAKEAGDAGGSVGRKLDPDLGNAGRYIADLPVNKDVDTLAAIPTDGGHWRLVNRSGEKITVSTPEEMERALRVLAPAALASDTSLAIVLAPDAVFAARKSLDKLPSSAKLKVLIDKRAVPLVRGPASDSTAKIYAAFKPNVLVEMATPGAFREVTYQLTRALRPADIRVLSITEKPAQKLSRLVRRDKTSKRVLADRVSADRLATGMAALRGQTAILTGRVDGSTLTYRTSWGSERTLNLEAVRKAAADSDVNLVILNAPTPRQPGARNWLWQKANVSGLDDALGRQTTADFLNALADSQGKMAVTVAENRLGRVTLTAEPLGGVSSEPVTGFFSDFIGEVLSETAGQVATRTITVDAVDETRDRELKSRIIPGVPSWIQIGYVVALVAGMFGWPFSRAWWFYLWPPEDRRAYASAIGYHLARGARLLLFLVVFLSAVGVPAALCNLGWQIWTWVTLPFRLIGWLFRRGPREAA